LFRAIDKLVQMCSAVFEWLQQQIVALFSAIERCFVFLGECIVALNNVIRAFCTYVHRVMTICYDTVRALWDTIYEKILLDIVWARVLHPLVVAPLQKAISFALSCATEVLARLMNVVIQSLNALYHLVQSILVLIGNTFVSIFDLVSAIIGGISILIGSVLQQCFEWVWFVQRVVTGVVFDTSVLVAQLIAESLALIQNVLERLSAR
jgi:phage-related protein